MGLVSMPPYQKYWSKSHLYYNNIYVKGKFSSHVFFKFLVAISRWRWLVSQYFTIITSPQQNYENNLWTIRDVIFRSVNVMVWQADFLTIYKECTESNFSNVALMIDLVLNIEAYFANQVSRYRSFLSNKSSYFTSYEIIFQQGIPRIPLFTDN